MSQSDALLLEVLRRLDEKADRIATALEKLSPSGGQGQKAINVVGIEGSAESRKKLADAIRSALAAQVPEDSSQQQPSPTERTPSQDEELRLGEAAQQSDTPPHP